MIIRMMTSVNHRTIIGTDRDGLDRDENNQTADLRDDNLDQQRGNHEGEREGVRTHSGRLLKLPVKFNEYVVGLVATDNEPGTFSEGMKVKDADLWSKAV